MVQGEKPNGQAVFKRYAQPLRRRGIHESRALRVGMGIAVLKHKQRVI